MEDPKSPQSEHQRLLAQVLIRVGRNLLLYQQIELGLKASIPYVHPEGSAAGRESFERLLTRLKEKSLGEQMARLKQTLTGDKEDMVAFDAYLGRVLESRNDLAHNFLTLPGISINDPEGCKSAIRFLDESHSVAEPLLQMVLALAAVGLRISGDLDPQELERLINGCGGSVLSDDAPRLQ
jgi:hypothetical protein